MSIEPHFEAEVHFLTSEDGGRQQPVRSGYRVIHDLYGDGTYWDGVHTFTDRDQVHPGETVVARITLLAPEIHRGKLRPGLEFMMREGAKLVARGRILRLLDASLAGV